MTGFLTPSDKMQHVLNYLTRPDLDLPEYIKTNNLSDVQLRNWVQRLLGAASLIFPDGGKTEFDKGYEAGRKKALQEMTAFLNKVSK